MAQTTRTYTPQEKAYFAAQYLSQHNLVTPKKETLGTENRIFTVDAEHFDNPGNLKDLEFTSTNQGIITNTLVAQENSALLEELYHKITLQDSTKLKAHKQKSSEVVGNTSSDNTNAKLILGKYRQQANALIALARQGGNLIDFLETAYLLFEKIQRIENVKEKVQEDIAYLLARHISDHPEIQRQYVELFQLVNGVVTGVTKDAKNLGQSIKKINEHIFHYPALALRFADQAPERTIKEIREEASLPLDEQIAELKKTIGINDETLGILKTIDSLHQLINQVAWDNPQDAKLIQQAYNTISQDNKALPQNIPQSLNEGIIDLIREERRQQALLAKKRENNPSLNDTLEAKKTLISEWLALEKQRDVIHQTHSDDALASCARTDSYNTEITTQSLETLDLYHNIKGHQKYFITQDEHTQKTTRLFQQKIENHSLLPNTKVSRHLFENFKETEQSKPTKPNRKWTRDLVTLWEDAYHQLSKINYAEEGIDENLGTQEIIRVFCHDFNAEKETPQNEKAQCLKSYESFFQDFLKALASIEKKDDKNGVTYAKYLSKFDGITLSRYYLFYIKLKYDLSENPLKADEIIRKAISGEIRHFAKLNQLNKIDLPMLSRLAQIVKKQLRKPAGHMPIRFSDFRPSTDSDKTDIRGHSPVSNAGSDTTTELYPSPDNAKSSSSNATPTDTSNISEQLRKLEEVLTDFYDKNDSDNINLPQVTAFVTNAINSANLADKIDQLYHAGNIIKARLDNTKLFSFSGATTRGLTFFGCYKTQRQQVYDALKPLADLKPNASQQELLKTLQQVNANLDQALGKNSKKVAAKP